MRKAKWLAGVLACGMALGSAIGLAGCGHTHTAGTAWEKDADQHWHVCTEDDEKMDVANHTWDNGTEVSAATYTGKGSKKYKCTVCDYEKTEDIAALTHTGSYTLSGTGSARSTGWEEGQPDDVTAYVNLTIDFTNKEAEIEVLWNMYFGYVKWAALYSTESYISTGYEKQMMGTIDGTTLGKGSVTVGNEDGTYKATWGSGDTAFVVDIASDKDGNLSANVAVPGYLTGTVAVKDMATSIKMSGTGSARSTSWEEGQPDDVTAYVNLTVDLAKNEADIEVLWNMYSGYVKWAAMYSTESYISEGYTKTMMEVLNGTEIGKGTVTGRNGSYKATWGTGDSAFVVEFNLDASGNLVGSVAVDGYLTGNVAITSAPAQA